MFQGFQLFVHQLSQSLEKQNTRGQLVGCILPKSDKKRDGDKHEIVT